MKPQEIVDLLATLAATCNDVYAPSTESAGVAMMKAIDGERSGDPLNRIERPGASKCCDTL